MLVSPFSVPDLERLPLEKVLFRQPTVFVGGYTVAAMEFVNRGGDNDNIGEPLLDSIHSLLDKSLLPQLPPVEDEEEDEWRLPYVGNYA